MFRLHEGGVQQQNAPLYTSKFKGLKCRQSGVGGGVCTLHSHLTVRVGVNRECSNISNDCCLYFTVSYPRVAILDNAAYV